MRFSLSGWSWKVWARKQASAIKTLVAAALGIVAAYVASPPLSPQVAALAAPAFAIVSRLVLDLVDYWLTEAPE